MKATVPLLQFECVQWTNRMAPRSNWSKSARRLTSLPVANNAAQHRRRDSYLPTKQQPKWRSFGEDVIESHFAHITQTNFITSRAEHRTSNNVHPTRNLIPLRAFQCPPFCAPPDARDPIVEKATPPCTVVPNVLLRALKVSL